MIKLMKTLCIGAVGMALSVAVSAAILVYSGIGPYFVCAAVVAFGFWREGALGVPCRTVAAFIMGVGCGLIWPVTASVDLLLLSLRDFLELMATRNMLKPGRPLTTLEAKLIAMNGDQMIELIDDFVEAPDVVCERLQGLGWSEMEVIHFGALIKTAAQHRLIDGNAWRGRIKSA